MSGSGAAIAVAVVVAYVIGTFPTAQLVGRRRGFDPTTTGSGNPGASNTTRVGGMRAGAQVLAGDAGKGVLAAALGYAAGGRTAAWAAGAAAVAGHMWPVTRRFRGGKGVATVAGVGLVCEPIGVALAAVVFAIVVSVGGRAALGSLVAAVLLPLTLLVLGREWVEVVIAAALGVAIIVRHRSNIGRLLSGTESRVRGERGSERPDRAR
ncbi:MAG: glycerol-3-phosphate acyltransferase [Acidimicrobiales bacterium]